MGGARARRAPLHAREAPYGRHWRDFLKGLFVVGWRRWRAPSNYIFSVNTFAIGGSRTFAKSAFGAQGAHGPVPPPLPTPLNLGII